MKTQYNASESFTKNYMSGNPFIQESIYLYQVLQAIVPISKSKNINLWDSLIN